MSLLSLPVTLLLSLFCPLVFTHLWKISVLLHLNLRSFSFNLLYPLFSLPWISIHILTYTIQKTVRYHIIFKSQLISPYASKPPFFQQKHIFLQNSRLFIFYRMIIFSNYYQWGYSMLHFFIKCQINLRLEKLFIFYILSCSNGGSRKTVPYSCFTIDTWHCLTLLIPL